MIGDPLAGAAAAGFQAGLIGLAVGLLLGFAARAGDFCTLGALESAVLGHDSRRLHIWALAMGVATLAVQGGAAAGLIALRLSYYHDIAWNPLASLAGGLLFGWGMALAGNCGFGALLRAGAGDIRSLLIVLVLGISAYVALAGPLGPLRARIFPQVPAAGPSGIAETLTRLAPVPPLVVAGLLAGGLIALGLAHPGVRRSPATIAGAAGVGLSVALALGGTTWLADHSLGGIAVEGPSFTAPVGRAVLYLMTATGTAPSFSVGLIFGTLLGAFAYAALRRTFRWEACDDPRELGRQLGGAVLMGIGGVIAMGCTIGQGLTATATLAWSGPVTLAAIAAGAWVGLQHLVAGPER